MFIELLTLVFNFGTLVMLGLLLYDMKNKRAASHETNAESDDEEPTAFDARIAELKEELRHGTPAQEMHPLVKNLPHTNEFTSRPEFEYAE